MNRSFQADRLSIKAFAQEGEALSGFTPLQNMERLAEETQGLQPESAVKWTARAELRARPGADADIWLSLDARTSVQLACQRCMNPMQVALEVNQWYRFVETEDVAMAEDDQSEEDLLVLEPHFNLLALLEDELLMALPLVPMHEKCPTFSLQPAGEMAIPEEETERRNPFAVLAQLIKDGGHKH